MSVLCCLQCLIVPKEIGRVEWPDGVAARGLCLLQCRSPSYSAFVSRVLYEVRVDVHIPLVDRGGVHVFPCGVFQTVVDDPPFRSAVALEFEPPVPFDVKFLLPFVQYGLEQGSERLALGIFSYPVVLTDRGQCGFCKVGDAFDPVAPEFVEPEQGILRVSRVAICLGKHQYDFDAATAIGFLRQYGLDKDFKLNIEANHATLAGHTFEHDLRISAINGMLGSIDANQGDAHLGWDTDEFPFDVYTATMAMYEILNAGGLTGGFNFDAKNRRPSYTYEDMFAGYILGMDTFALGLIKAAALIEDGRLQKNIEERYSSYHNSEIGKKIVSGKTDLKELAAYADRLGAPALPGSGKQEVLQSIVNGVLYGKQ